VEETGPAACPVANLPVAIIFLREGCGERPAAGPAVAGAFGVQAKRISAS